METLGPPARTVSRSAEGLGSCSVYPGGGLSVDIKDKLSTGAWEVH
jgi:hypothetical protein